MMLPKPRYSKLREQARRERREKDRAFQEQAKTCIVCGRKAGRHHRIKRRYLAYRWDDRFTLDLCWDHHQEIERTGEVAFCAEHGLTLIPLPPRFR